MRLLRPALVVVLGSALLADGCRNDPSPSPSAAGSSTAPEDHRDAKGALDISRDVGAAVHLDLDDCWSGQMLQFHGVEVFHDPEIGRRIRVVEDPVEGTRVVLLGIVPERARVILDARACATFDVHVESTNNYLNQIARLRGAIRLACVLPDGAGQLTVNVELRDCSFDNRAKSL